MLIYDPSLDPYHTSIRVLAVLDKHIEGLNVDLARILDFYLAFPSKVSEIRLPQNLTFIRTEAKKLNSPYRSSPNNNAQFEKMRPIFYASLHGLASLDYLNSDFATRGELIVNLDKIPTDLKLAVTNFKSRHNFVKDFIIESLSLVKLFGPDGLKDRTGLLEYKYDNI